MPHPRSPTVSDGIDQAEDGPQEERIAEQISAQTIPSGGGCCEELLRLGPAAGECVVESLLVLSGGGRCGHLFSDQRPQTARARIEIVERHAVKAAGTVAPRRHPVVVSERFQMTTDARLRQPQHGAQL